MFLELVAAGFLIGQFIYHRWIEDHPENVERIDESDIPVTEEGQARPLVFGRVRVCRPILAWIDRPHAFPGAGVLIGKTKFSMSMLYVIGAPFDSCQGTNRMHAIWVGDLKLKERFPDPGPGLPAFVKLEDLDGNGLVEDINRNQCNVAASVFSDGEAEISIDGMVEYLNGKPAQLVVDAGFPYNAQTRAAVQMTNFTGTTEDDLQGEVAPSDVPGYRGVLCAFLYGTEANSANLHFNYGISPQVGAFSFEVSAYHTNHAQLGTFCQVGLESNPINVLYDILTATQGKLGMSPTLIDIASFQAAQLTLHQESNGYSRAFEERMTAAEMIDEVLRQIDGVLYEDMITGKIKIKLVRADFDPNTIPHITKANCKTLTGFAMGGRGNVVNKIRVVFNNRDKDYTDDSAVAQNMANAVGQDGQVVEEVIEYPGCCDPLLADRLAGRELAARSRPLIKCRAIVNRSLLRVNPGDAVKLVWKNPDVSGLIFRVAAVDRGTLEDGAIGLDLIQDFNYTWRNQTPQPPDFGNSGIGDLEIGP